MSESSSIQAIKAILKAKQPLHSTKKFCEPVFFRQSNNSLTSQTANNFLGSSQYTATCAVFGAGTRVSSYGVDNMALSSLSARSVGRGATK